MISLSRITTLYHSLLTSLESSRVHASSLSLIFIRVIATSKLKKEINGKPTSLLIVDSSNLILCTSGFVTAQLHFRLWWITSLLISMPKAKLQSILITFSSGLLVLSSITRSSTKYLNASCSTISISIQRSASLNAQRLSTLESPIHKGQVGINPRKVKVITD